MIRLLNCRLPSKLGEYNVYLEKSIEKIVPSNKDNGNCFIAEIDLKGHLLMPAAADPHVHLRQPGYEQKETVFGGTASAIKGGFDQIMAMPNLNPTPDCEKNFQLIQSIIDRDAKCKVWQLASVTKGEKGKELSDFAMLSKKVKAFSDDGVPVSDRNLLKQAMILAKEYGTVICSHAEQSGYGLSPQSEYLAVNEELKLVRETKCKYHFCHLSTKESFTLVEQALNDGLDVSCEVTPHHLTLFKNDNETDSNRKMNPPLRSEEDMTATVEALQKGIATMIATDHAPHTEEEKNREYALAPNGIIGLLTMFPVIYSALVKTGKITEEQLVNFTSRNAISRFLLDKNELNEGQKCNICALKLVSPTFYSKEDIISKAKNSPFINKEYYGFNSLTVIGGKIVYADKDLKIKEY